MKNHVYCIGLLLVGVGLANGLGFGLPSLPKLPNPLNPKASYNSPSLPGGPSFSVNVSGNAGSVAEGLMQPKLPQFPGLPQLGGNSGSNGNSGSSCGLPQLPGVPSFPGAPKLPGFPSLPGMPSLPGFPGSNSSSNSLSNSSSFGNLPGVPNFFDPNALSNLMPNASNFANPNSTVGNALDGLQSAVKNANNSANQALSNFQDFSNNLSEQIKNASDAAQSRVKEQLQGLSSGVRSCVEENGNPGQAGVQAAQQSAMQCVQKKVEEAVSIVSNTRSDVQAAQLGLDYVRGNLSNCRVNVSMSLAELPTYDSSSPSCVAAALFSIQPETILLPINLATNGAQAVALVQGLQAYAMKRVANMMGKVAKASLENTLAIGKGTPNRAIKG
uniref:Allergen Cul o 11 n=1 Tax=Culicoides obsoletus TaxID=289301 RepID=A0A7U3REC8_CULOB|nr:allergen Cul o 11 [Culicoides obsoletus]